MKAKQITLSELLSWINFSFYIENGKIKLVDNEGANLGDIQSEEFDDVEQVLERLDNYLSSTFLAGEICFDNKDLYFNDFIELKEYCDTNNIQPISDVVNAIINPETIILK